MNLVRLRPTHVSLPARPPERTGHDAVVVLLAEAARVPPPPPRFLYLVAQIVLLCLCKQNLGLLCQTRHVREPRRPAARTSTHEALLRFPMDGLRADVARLALRVGRARLDRDRDGLLVVQIRMILIVSARLFYRLAELVVPALFPVLHLAFGPTVARAAAAAFLAQ